MLFGFVIFASLSMLLQYDGSEHQHLGRSFLTPGFDFSEILFCPHLEKCFPEAMKHIHIHYEALKPDASLLFIIRYKI